MSSLPGFDGGDPLIYHRLTGITKLWHGANRSHVRELIRRGGVLKPFDERGEYAEAHGIGVIDIVAGDTAAIFFSPFKPVGTSLGSFGWGSQAKQPGVAFRLSTLQRYGSVTVRPADFETFYWNAVRFGDLAQAYDRIGVHADTIYDNAEALGSLQDCLDLISTAEREATRELLQDIARGVDLSELEVRIKFAAAKRAADQTRDLLEAAAVYLGVSEEDTEKWIDDTLMGIAYHTQKAANDAQEAWGSVSLDRVAEVLLWGSIPLREASLVFDSEGWERFDSAQTEMVFEGLTIVAGKQRTG